VIAAHEKALASGEGVLKDGRRTAVTRVRRGADWLCVKEYRSSGLLDRMKDWLRGPRAERAWRAAERLGRCGVPTPEPIAAIERRGVGYLVTRFVEDGVPLNRLLAERFGGALSPGEVASKRSLVRRLAAWLRRVHDCRIYHDDWSCKNILAAERAEGWQFWLLDLDSVSPRRRLTWRRRVKNLGQLADTPAGISRTDRMRFLVVYAAGDASLARGRFPSAVLEATRRRVEARERRLAEDRH